MKRNFLIANTVLFAVFFMVVLGMRNTSLDHNGGPKQRPRAVIEDVSKAPITICCQLHLDAEPCPTFAIAALPEARTCFTLVPIATPVTARQFLPTRASPTLLGRLA